MPACAALTLPPGSGRYRPIAPPGHRPSRPHVLLCHMALPPHCFQPTASSPPPTVKRRRSPPSQSFLPAPPFPCKEHAESTPTPLPPVRVSPPEHRQSHWNRSYHHCDLCLIGERRFQAVSRPNGFAPHLPRTPPVLQVPSPAAVNHRRPTPS
jgi:hypothetical protein